MENLKQKLVDLKSKLPAFMKNIGMSAIVIGAMCLGAFARDIYVKVSAKQTSFVENVTTAKPRDISETSIAINERGELMIIDREDNSCQLFKDNVGKVIFDMYAARIYINKNK